MRLGIAALALMSLAMPVLANPPAAIPTLDTELAAIASDPERPLASLSVLAIRDGKVVYEHQFGRRYIDANNPANDRPAEAATLYRVASISKLVTALGVMRLVEQGRLSLDGDVSEYLGYRLRNPHFPETPITLRMLLTHTASLRDDAGYVQTAGEMREFLVPGGKLHGMGGMWSWKSKPGEYFTYCNLNSGVVGTIMEKATGERFDRLMQRLVLEPLGMRGGFNPAEMPMEQVGNIATTYRKATAGDEQVWNPKGPWIAQGDDYSAQPPVNRVGSGYVIGSNGAIFSPQGGLRASAADLGRVMQMLMNRGTIDGKRFLESRTVDAMFARHWKWDGGTNGESWRESMQAWGLGNQQFVDASGPGTGDRLIEGGGFTAVGHTGNSYGLHGAFVFDPATKNGIVYLAGGTGFDPDTDRGQYSGTRRYEERILTAVYRRAIQGKTEP